MTEIAQHSEVVVCLVIHTFVTIHFAVNDALFVCLKFFFIKVLMVECVDEMQYFGLKLDR